jgi:hypothetical protein
LADKRTKVYLLDIHIAEWYAMSVIKLRREESENQAFLSPQQTGTLGLREIQACGGDVRHPSP